MLLAEDRRQKVNIAAAWNGTGTAPAGSVVNISAAAGSVLGVQVSGTFTATLQFEGRIAETDDVNDWFAITGIPVAGGVGVTNVAAAGRWFFQYAGLRAARVRCSAYTSGTPVVTMNISAGSPTGAGGSGASGAVTIVDGGDVALGTTTDAGIITDTSGTAIGFLRGAILRWNTFLSRIPAALVGGRLDVNLGAAPATVTTAGALTNNNAAPGANNVGVLPAIANAVSPTYTEGDQVLLSATLSGHVRSVVQGFQAAGVATASNPVMMGLNGTGAVVRYAVDAVAGFPTVGTGVAAVHHGVFDGTNFQKSLQVTQATGNTGVGLPAAGPLLWDLVGTTNFVKQAGDGSGRAMVVGPAASGAAVAGNPVLTGGTDGTNAQAWKSTITNPGFQRISIGAASAVGDNLTATLNVSLDENGVQRSMVVAPQVFNGSGWDRPRNNVDVTLLASAARTTLQNSGNITTYNCKGIIVTVDVTATTSTVSLTPSINYIDPASGKTIPLLTGTTIAATGTFTYWVNENAITGTPAPFTKTAQANLGRIISINMAVGNSNSQTYSIGYTLIP